MTTEAFVGNVFLWREKQGSPGEYEKVCQVFGISGLGQTNALIDATTFCSGGSREYIGGLADGTEVSIECNFEQNALVLREMIDDVSNKASRNFQVRVEDGSPTLAFAFLGICLGWTLNPSVDDRNTITYTVKISGDITITG